MHRACRGFIFLGVFTFLACVAPVHAIVNVSVITKDRKPIKANPSLRCVPINGNARPVSVAMVVDTLDELSCDQSGFDLELSDSSWSIRMTSPFKALYLGVVDGATVVMLETGDCTVQSSVPSEIRSGMVRLGARGTLYGMSVSDSDTVRTCYLFEGGAVCSTGTAVDTLGPGQTVTAKPSGVTVRGAVDSLRIERTATMFASMDVAKARIHGVASDSLEGAADSLRTLYATAFRNPTDGESRRRLGCAQVALRLPSEGLYHLARAEVLTPSSRAEDRVTIAAARSEAYVQLGHPERAKSELADVRSQYAGIAVPWTIPTTVGKSPVRVTDPSTVASGGDYLAQLVRSKEYLQAATGYDGRIKYGSKEARDYFGLAAAQAKIGNKEAASWNAAVALKADSIKSELTPSERTAARSMAKQLDPGQATHVMRAVSRIR